MAQTNMNYTSQNENQMVQTYNQLTNDEDFWKGCQTCSNYPKLLQAKRKKCKCTGMLMDPGKV